MVDPDICGDDSECQISEEITTFENEEGEDLNYGLGYFIDNKEENKEESKK